MKQVWICDFCSEKHEESENIRIHEMTCTFNPARRSCSSCGNADVLITYSAKKYMVLCKIKTADHKRRQCPVVEHCPSWVPEA